MPRIVRFHAAGSADVLRIEDLPDRPLRDGEIRMSVDAFALNRADVLFRNNQYIESPVFPSLLGYDAAGVVTEVASGVREVAVGDRVLTFPGFSQGDHGVYGEAAVVPADSVMRYDESVGAAEASCVGVSYFTGYFALAEIGALREGDWALLSPGTSSTGVAAIQIAHALGARVIATTRQRSKAQVLEELGADAVIVTGEESIADRTRAITGGAGVRMVYDAVGGKDIPEFLRCLAMGGRILVYGVLDMAPATVSGVDFLRLSASLHGYTVFSWTGNSDRGWPRQKGAVARAMDFLGNGLRSGQIRPVVSETFPLDRVADAHRAMESNRQVGNIVVTTK